MTPMISSVGVACIHGIGSEALLLHTGEFSSDQMTSDSHLRHPVQRHGVQRESSREKPSWIPAELSPKGGMTEEDTTELKHALRRIYDFDPSGFVSQRKSLKLMNRASQLGIAAGKIALQQRTLDLTEAGLFLSVGMSGGELSSLSAMLSESLNEQGELDLLSMGSRGLSRVNPLLSFLVLNNMPLCHLSIELGVHGPHAAFYCKDAAGGLRALDRAARCIAQQEAKLALAGGADSPLDTINLALTTHKQPAEGAAILVFSEEGDIAWLGVSEAHPTQEDALCALATSNPKILLDATQSEPFGDTQAAAASLFVAKAVAKLRASTFGTQAAVFAKTPQGFIAALLEKR